jgi:hypothetical protein
MGLLLKLSASTSAKEEDKPGGHGFEVETFLSVIWLVELCGSLKVEV